MIVRRLPIVLLLAILGATVPAWALEGVEKGRARPLGAPDEEAFIEGNYGRPGGSALPRGRFPNAQLARVSGMDTGITAWDLVTKTDPQVLEAWGAGQPWLRVRNLPDPSRPESRWTVLRERQALTQLQGLGFKLLPFLRWGNETWTGGIRAGGGKRLPIDLRDAYTRLFLYGKAYGGSVAGFEFENEPDISFVEENPETYAAFLKACYWGVRASDRAPQVKPWWQWLLTGPVLVPDFVDLGWRSQVVMAPLALPPGPFFEQLMKNDALGYTDAFNFHYYGYSEDFSDVYRQFEEAVARTGETVEQTGETVTEPGGVGGRIAGAAPERSAGVTGAGTLGPRREQKVKRLSGDAVAVGRTGEAGGSIPFHGVTASRSHRFGSLPVLLSEYGYGELDGPASGTVEGRVRQRDYFEAITRQMTDLRIAGPMAFVLRPYLENGAFEFGLTVAAQSAAVGGKAESGKRKAESGRSREAGGQTGETVGQAVEAVKRFSGETVGQAGETGESLPFHGVTASPFRRVAGGLTFTPADFGAEAPQPWMERIGQRFGGNEATPALAWLLEESHARPYLPRDWQVPEAKPSPVVIDFIAGSSLSQFKRYGGYIAVGAPQEGLSHASGELVLYNFSPVAVRGRLETGIAVSAIDHEIELAPMARVLVPVQLRIPAQRFTKLDWQVKFVPAARSAAANAESGRSREAEMVAPKVRPGANAEGDRSGRPLGSEGHKPERGTEGAALAAPAAQTGGDEAPPSTERTSLPPAVFATVLRPSTERMVETRILTRFDHPAAAASANAALLAARPRAGAEPVGETRGRWQVTKGAALSEVAPGWWRFSVDPYSTGSRRAMAELPLPDDFSFPPGALLRLRYRLLSPADTTFKTGRYLRVQIRTANGNLYSLFPWSRATAQWSEYMEAQENFTLMFYGRAALPWRFAENRPVALVLECGAGDEPVVFEIKDPRVVEIGASALAEKLKR